MDQKTVLLINTVIVGYLLFNAYRGYRIGFIRSVLPIITLIVAFAVSGPTQELLPESLTQEIEKRVNDATEIVLAAEQTRIDETVQSEPTKEILGQISSSVLSNSQFKAYAAKKTEKIVTIIMVSALLSLVMMGFERSIFSFLKVPIASVANHVGGACITLLSSILTIWIILTATRYLGTIIPTCSNLYTNIKQIPILNFLDSINPIIQFI